MGDKFEANYQVLQNVSNLLGERGGAIKQMMSQMQRQMEDLLREGWIGRGSDAFEAEMRQEILPMLSRMIHAFEESSSEVQNKVAKGIRDAEEQAGSRFR